MNPQLNSGTLQTYFNDVSILKFVKNSVKDLHGKVLDVGCGKMRYKDLILSEEKVREYIGLDLDEGKFTYSVKADLYWNGIIIPLENNSVESVVIFEVLEHCPDPRIVINEAFRILKSNGVILFSTPFIYHLHGSPFDYSRLTPFGVENMLKEAGFTNVEIRPGGRWDASLGQMISIWICNRPMPHIIRRILSRLYTPLFRLLLITDRKYSKLPMKDGTIIPNILGKAYKK